MLLPLLLNNLLESGAPTGTVPDVVGSTQAQADIDIVAAGFTTSITTDYSSTVAAGIVISQNPTGGSSAVLGSAVVIVVSLGAQTAQTPAGRPRRPHPKRMLVQIDGQDFEVGSQAEAEQLLQRARAIAERQAEKRAAVAEGNVARIAKRTGVIQPVKVVAPEIKASPELDLSPLIAEIQRLYAQAGEIAEMRLLLAKQMADEDDELLLL